jgi:tRNA threonylcarbamoyladenosine modification (KEOPS) complex  Pcc1 subunit
MTPIDFKTQQVANAIMSVIELAHNQGRTITWRTVFEFLQLPDIAWKDDNDLDEKIIIENEGDLVIMRAMISSMFHTKH